MKKIIKRGILAIFLLLLLFCPTYKYKMSSPVGTLNLNYRNYETVDMKFNYVQTVKEMYYVINLQLHKEYPGHLAYDFDAKQAWIEACKEYDVARKEVEWGSAEQKELFEEVIKACNRYYRSVGAITIEANVFPSVKANFCWYFITMTLLILFTLIMLIFYPLFERRLYRWIHFRHIAVVLLAVLFVQVSCPVNEYYRVLGISYWGLLLIIPMIAYYILYPKVEKYLN